MHEVGIVKSIEGSTARVMISREGSPCENCTQDTCTIPEKGIETEAINIAGAKSRAESKSCNDIIHIL